VETAAAAAAAAVVLAPLPQRAAEQVAATL